MENFKELKKLIEQSNRIKKAIDAYKNTYQVNARYDKIGFGFNSDSRFKACEGLNIYVASWKGVYGNSNCGTILSVDKDIFNKHLLKVLSQDFFGIMDRVSKSIEKEAKTLKTKAEEELKAQAESLKELDEIE